MTRGHRILSLAIATFISVAMVAAALVTASRFVTPIPSATLTASGPLSLTILPGTPPELVAPVRGNLSVETDSLVIQQRDADVVRPIASVAKVMTVLAVLDAHPLTLSDGGGPLVTMNQHDVDIWHQVIAQNGSNLYVYVGEKLTERDLLTALLIPSANNIAHTLAIWIDGSEAQFLARMNAKAVSLGMANTHYTDPSGFDAGTVSTANDLVRLAKVAMGNPVITNIVSQANPVLSDGDVLKNYDRNLGISGWSGIKIGGTPDAGWCLMFAEQRVLPGSPQPVTLYGAILNEADFVPMFEDTAKIMDAAFANVGWLNTGTLKPQTGFIAQTAWHQRDPVTVGQVSTSQQLLTFVGKSVPVSLTAQLGAERAPAGTQIGQLDAIVQGIHLNWPLTLSSAIPQAPTVWRLLRN